MPVPKKSHRQRAIAAFGIVAAAALAGCKNIPIKDAAYANAAIGGAAIALGARTPSHEIEQIYYLGVLDPQEQIPPTVYRVRVHGQASVLSGMDFGSGWVPAQMVDSLTTRIRFENGRIKIDDEASKHLATLQTGHRLVVFGPEGFREAPKDQRLVIVMGADPKAFFDAVDKALGDVGRALSTQQNATLTQMLLEDGAVLRTQRERLTDLKSDVDGELKAAQGDAR